jgi:hypothetical protein
VERAKKSKIEKTKAQPVTESWAFAFWGGSWLQKS